MTNTHHVNKYLPGSILVSITGCTGYGPYYILNSSLRSYRTVLTVVELDLEYSHLASMIFVLGCDERAATDRVRGRKNRTVEHRGTYSLNRDLYNQ